MEVPRYIQMAFIIVVVISTVLFIKNYFQDRDIQVRGLEKQIPITSEDATTVSISNREVSVAKTAVLPIKNIVAATQLKHSIPLEEIRQGCSRQDCIPSVDKPAFISVGQAQGYIVDKQIGIALSYKNEERFYPFSMLVTREIVNDTVADDPLLVTYCPLCGTGIVFDRTVDGTVYEFGVTGMLWQSNLLMYNRDEDITKRSIWSQVLGEAVVGEQTGTTLKMVTSDIMRFDTWAKQNPNGIVLDTGNQRDPYNGNYYAIAARFAPDFNPATSPLAPDAYVYGIKINGIAKAYPRDTLSEGVFNDMINETEVIITNRDGKVSFTTSEGKPLEDVEGFWFSWVAAHPNTLLWTK